MPSNYPIALAFVSSVIQKLGNGRYIVSEIEEVDEENCWIILSSENHIMLFSAFIG